MSRSGALAARMQAAVAPGEKRSRPALAAARPTNECVRLSTEGYRLQVAGFRFQVPVCSCEPLVWFNTSLNLKPETWNLKPNWLHREIWRERGGRQFRVALRIDLLELYFGLTNGARLGERLTILPLCLASSFHHFEENVRSLRSLPELLIGQRQTQIDTVAVIIVPSSFSMAL